MCDLSPRPPVPLVRLDIILYYNEACLIICSNTAGHKHDNEDGLYGELKRSGTPLIFIPLIEKFKPQTKKQLTWVNTGLPGTVGINFLFTYFCLSQSIEVTKKLYNKR